MGRGLRIARVTGLFTKTMEDIFGRKPISAFKCLPYYLKNFF